VSIVVVGSINQDVRLAVPRLPRAGETLRADGMRTGPGGKGANQAVAIARLGEAVAMVGAVGADASGAALLERLKTEGVDVRAVRTIGPTETEDGPATGMAIVLWDEPESTIVIESGANAHVDGVLLGEHTALLRTADVVLCQCETPASALAAVVEHAGGVRILNPAPAVPLPADLVGQFDLLVPNRHELAVLVGAPAAKTVDEAHEQVRSLDFHGDVVVTLGEDGALVVPADRSEAPTRVAAHRVAAIDTTAAGDSFCAALAIGARRGLPLVQSARWAAAVAASTTTRHGAMDSLPRLEQVGPPPTAPGEGDPHASVDRELPEAARS
jgi:ribokinase